MKSKCSITWAMPLIFEFSYAPPKRFVIERETTGRGRDSCIIVMPFLSLVFWKFMLENE